MGGLSRVRRQTGRCGVEARPAARSCGCLVVWAVRRKQPRANVPRWEHAGCRVRHRSAYGRTLCMRVLGGRLLWHDDDRECARPPPRVLNRCRDRGRSARRDQRGQRKLSRGAHRQRGAGRLAAPERRCINAISVFLPWRKREQSRQHRQLKARSSRSRVLHALAHPSETPPANARQRTPDSARDVAHLQAESSHSMLATRSLADHIHEPRASPSSRARFPWVFPWVLPTSPPRRPRAAGGRCSRLEGRRTQSRAAARPSMRARVGGTRRVRRRGRVAYPDLARAAQSAATESQGRRLHGRTPPRRASQTA